MTARALVLGAAGGIGSVAAHTLAATDDFSEIGLGDLRLDAAEEVADRLPRGRAHPVAVDVTGAGLEEVLGGYDVVVNCVGPFYRFGPDVLAASITAGVDYVDVCDDLDATERQLALSGNASSRGVRAVVGLGNSPGLANLLVRYAADELLDSCTAADIFHVHGGEPTEGPAVIQHRIHAMVNEVPVFDGGMFRSVRMLEASGREWVVQTNFRDVGTFPVYPYPHPETITLPRHIEGIRRVTNRGVVFPLSYFEHTIDVVRRGLAAAGATSPLPVGEWTKEILAERARLLEQAGVTGPKGCLKVEVAGESGGEPQRYVFSVSSETEGAGAGTGIPAGIGAVLLARGAVSRTGVHPPEAVIRPLEALTLAGRLLPRLPAGIVGAGASGDSEGPGIPLHVLHVGPDGTESELSVDL